MRIIHILNNFIYTIFPTVKKGDIQGLMKALEEFYTIESTIPNVSVKDDLVIVSIDTKPFVSEKSEFNKVVHLCENGQYQQAKPLLQNLIEKNPTNSEYYRILGQIASDEGNQDEAINILIDALRWNPKNGWALLMMGNIFAKFKDDVPTAMQYYDQALLVNPNDNITMNNIGANLMQQEKLDEAAKYFLKAKDIDPEYPNTHFALGMVYDLTSDYELAFECTLEALKYNKKKDVLYQNSLKQLFEIAQKLIEKNTIDSVYKDYIRKLEFRSELEIKIEETTDIPTPAKFEFAENFNREYHLIRYNPSSPAYQHLIMHELVHLEFVLDARDHNCNKLFVAHQGNKEKYIRSIQSHIRKLSKQGYDDEAISQMCSELFEGLNSQIFNCPIDLFIEENLYNRYPELRPYQFVSMLQIMSMSLKSVTDSQILRVAPPATVSNSKVYNLVSAMQFKALYGINLIDDFKASPKELKEATAMYEEYMEYKDDKEPGEEYELIQHWADDLNVNIFFELVDENKFRSSKKVESILEEIEKDPFGDDLIISKEKKIEMDRFFETHSMQNTNMGVVMYMVDALVFFSSKSQEEIKAIAYEIAMQGTQGYDPKKEGYRISSIKGRTFGGYHILAYYYVSWAIAIPEMLEKLGLPFDTEYEIAKKVQSQT